MKGYVKDLLYDGRTGRNTSDSIFVNAISRSSGEEVAVENFALSTVAIRELIEAKRQECAYGLCLIASDRRTLRQYAELEDFACDLFYPSSRNVSNLLIVSPAADADLSGFRDIIFLDTPADYNLAALAGRQVFVNREICGYKMLDGLDITREALLEIYSALRREVSSLCGNDAEELATFCHSLGFERRQFIFALRVFEELGLVSFAEGRLIVYRGVKAELTNSAVYRKVFALVSKK